MKLPTEMQLFVGDVPVLVRFDFQPGEQQWFDPRKGVGSPGYEVEVDITGINFGGTGWMDADALADAIIEKFEAQVLEGLAEYAQDDRDDRGEAEWEARKDRQTKQEPQT